MAKKSYRVIQKEAIPTGDDPDMLEAVEALARFYEAAAALGHPVIGKRREVLEAAIRQHNATRRNSAADPYGAWARPNPSKQALSAMRQLEEAGILDPSLAGNYRRRKQSRKGIKVLTERIGQIDAKLDEALAAAGGEEAFVARLPAGLSMQQQAQYARDLAAYETAAAAATLIPWEDVPAALREPIESLEAQGYAVPPKLKTDMRRLASGLPEKPRAPRKRKNPSNRKNSGARSNPGVRSLAVALPNPAGHDAPAPNSKEIRMARRNARANPVTKNRLADLLRKVPPGAADKATLTTSDQNGLKRVIVGQLKRAGVPGLKYDISLADLQATVATNAAKLVRAGREASAAQSAALARLKDAAETKKKIPPAEREKLIRKVNGYARMLEGQETGGQLNKGGKAAVLLGWMDSPNEYAVVRRPKIERVVESKLAPPRAKTSNDDTIARAKIARLEERLKATRSEAKTFTKAQVAQVLGHVKALQAQVKSDGGQFSDKKVTAMVKQLTKARAGRGGVRPATAAKLRARITALEGIIAADEITGRQRSLLREGPPRKPATAAQIAERTVKGQVTKALKTGDVAAARAAIAGSSASQAVKDAQLARIRSNPGLGLGSLDLPWNHLMAPAGQGALAHYGGNVVGGALAGFVGGTVLSNVSGRLLGGMGPIGGYLGRWGVPLGTAWALSAGKLGTARLPAGFRAWAAGGVVLSAVAQNYVSKMLTGNWFGGPLFRRVLGAGSGTGDLYDQAFDPGLYEDDGLMDGFYQPSMDGTGAYIQVDDGMDAYIQVDDGGLGDTGEFYSAATDAYIQVDDGMGEFYEAPVDGFYEPSLDGAEMLDDDEEELDHADLHAEGLGDWFDASKRWGRFKLGKAQVLKRKYGPAATVLQGGRRGYAVVGIPNEGSPAAGGARSGGGGGVPVIQHIGPRQAISTKVGPRNAVQPYAKSPVAKLQQGGVFAEPAFGPPGRNAFGG